MRETESGPNPARKWWLGPVFWALLLFVASSIPGTSYPQTSFQFADKFVHCGIYGVFSFLLAFAARRNFQWGAFKVWAFAVGMSTIYGATDEFHQMFVPNRSSDLRDLLADAVGAAIGAALVLLLARTKATTPRV